MRTANQAGHRPPSRQSAHHTSAFQRPVAEDGEDKGKGLYYVLLIAAPVTRPGQAPMVEARLAENMSVRGHTEAEAISALIDRIRAGGGEATLSRLRVWRSLWRPPHERTRSFEAA